MSALPLPPRKRGFRRYVDRDEDKGLDGLSGQAPGAGLGAARAGGGDDAAPEPDPVKAGDGSTHEWAPGQRWDLIITLDDAT